MSHNSSVLFSYGPPMISSRRTSWFCASLAFWLSCTSVAQGWVDSHSHGSHCECDNCDDGDFEAAIEAQQSAIQLSDNPRQKQRFMLMLEDLQAQAAKAE